MKDQTKNPEYLFLRHAAAEKDELAALQQTLLHAGPEKISIWMETAYIDLRRALIRGRISSAEAISNLLYHLLAAEVQYGDHSMSPQQMHHQEIARTVFDGISAVLAHDDQSGLEQLRTVSVDKSIPSSWRWVALIWSARAAANCGDLFFARQAAALAVQLALELDMLAQGTSFCTASELSFVAGENERGEKYLASAINCFAECGDERGSSMAALTLAKMLLSHGREEEAIQAAKRAGEVDPQWEQPQLFLSQRALIRGDLKEAERLVPQSLGGKSVVQTPEIMRQLTLIKMVKQGVIPPMAVSSYLWLREQPPSVEVVAQLQDFLTQYPRFYLLRELLGWTLFKIGFPEEAREHLENLFKVTEDPVIHHSALLVLGWIAKRNQRGKHPGVALRAAVSVHPGATSEKKTDKIDVPQELIAAASSVANPPPAKWSAIDIVTPLGIQEVENVSAASTSVLSGDLVHMPLPDLLEFLRNSRRSGTVILTSPAGLGAIHLRLGMISGAITPNTPQLGAILISHGLVSEGQLNEVFEYQSKHGMEKLFGELLLERNLVSSETLKTLLTEQTKKAVDEMLAWETGAFAFEPDMPSDATTPPALEITIDVQEIMFAHINVTQEQIDAVP